MGFPIRLMRLMRAPAKLIKKFTLLARLGNKTSTNWRRGMDTIQILSNYDNLLLKYIREILQLQGRI